MLGGLGKYGEDEVGEGLINDIDKQGIIPLSLDSFTHICCH